MKFASVAQIKYSSDKNQYIYTNSKIITYASKMWLQMVADCKTSAITYWYENWVWFYRFDMILQVNWQLLLLLLLLFSAAHKVCLSVCYSQQVD